MKIICETSIALRNSNVKGRFQKTNLALAKKKDGDNVQIIVQSKTQTRYDLKNNVSNVFKRFIDEGKCTISFKVPEIDLQIKGDSIQIKAFLNAIKSELCPSQANTCKPLQTTSKLNSIKAPTNEIVTRLIIKSRAGFAAKGFPRTLKELTINSVGCSQMPIGILNLTNLTTLDLTNNNIEKLPNGLGKLRLSKVILDQNQLGKTQISDWTWLNGNIKDSLSYLSISINCLNFFPPQIVECRNIVQLDLRSNEICALPSAIKALVKLKYLNVSNNRLKTLPYTVVKLKLEVIDIGSNCFLDATDPAVLKTDLETVSREIQARAPSLFELASSIVIERQIPYMRHNIPTILKDVLACSPICVNSRCETFCFDRQIYKGVSIIAPTAKKIFTSDNCSSVLADGSICSPNCVRTLLRKFCRNVQLE